MPKIRIKDAAAYLSVSDDTVRRWIDAGLLPAETDASNRKVVDGYALATFAKSHANPMADPSSVGRSARNRFVGLVTDIITRQGDGPGRAAVRPVPGRLADEQ